MTEVSNREFDSLIAAYLDQTITEDQMRTLAMLMAEDRQRVRRLAEFGQIEHMIASEVLYGEHAQAFRETQGADPSTDRSNAALARLVEFDRLSGDDVELVDVTRQRRHDHADAGKKALGSLFTSPVFFIGIAAAVVVAGVFWFLWPKTAPAPPTTSTPTAQPDEDRLQVISSPDAVWGDGSSRDELADLEPGAYELSRGHARLVYPSGAEVVLEAPVRFSVDARPRIRLRSGKLVSNCLAPGSAGLVVQTDHARITDMGAEFGINFNSGLTSITVFEGEVDLTTNRGKTDRIEQEHTAQLDNREGMSKLTKREGVDQSFTRALPAGDSP